MEALNLLKFWRSPIRRDNVAVDYVIDYDSSDDEEFFELELNSIKYSNEHYSKLVESPRDVFRNATVFPFDSPNSTSKPQSPISFPKFKVFLLAFKKSKETTKTDQIGESKRFSLKTNIEQVPVLSPDNSLRATLLKENFQDNKKDVPKYINVIKPVYTMASKRDNADNKLSSEVMSSPRFSPSSRTSGLRNLYKNLGKSKSLITASPVNMRDDSLLQDGIQSAILHCKTSYNYPAKELSRCVSDPAREKSGFGRLDSEPMKRNSFGILRIACFSLSNENSFLGHFYLL